MGVHVLVALLLAAVSHQQNLLTANTALVQSDGLYSGRLSAWLQELERLPRPGVLCFQEIWAGKDIAAFTRTLRDAFPYSVAMADSLVIPTQPQCEQYITRPLVSCLESSGCGLNSLDVSCFTRECGPEFHAFHGTAGRPSSCFACFWYMVAQQSELVLDSIRLCSNTVLGSQEVSDSHNPGLLLVSSYPLSAVKKGLLNSSLLPRGHIYAEFRAPDLGNQTVGVTCTHLSTDVVEYTDWEAENLMQLTTIDQSAKAQNLTTTLILGDLNFSPSSERPRRLDLHFNQSVQRARVRGWVDLYGAGPCTYCRQNTIVRFQQDLPETAALFEPRKAYVLDHIMVYGKAPNLTLERSLLDQHCVLVDTKTTSFGTNDITLASSISDHFGITARPVGSNASNADPPSNAAPRSCVSTSDAWLRSSVPLLCCVALWVLSIVGVRRWAIRRMLEVETPSCEGGACGDAASSGGPTSATGHAATRARASSGVSQTPDGPVGRLMAALSELTPVAARASYVQWEGLAVSFDGAPGLSPTSGHIEDREIVAVMGPSGSGKTTFLKALAGVPIPDADVYGAVSVDGRCLEAPLVQTAVSSFSPQFGCFFGELTVAETMHFTAMIGVHTASLEPTAIAELIRSGLEALGLSGRASCRMELLSGGEVKRAQVCCALLSGSRFLLLDEPTSGLSAHEALQFMRVCREVSDAGLCSVLMTLHQPCQRSFECLTRVMCLCQGRLVYFATPAAVLQHLTKEVGFVGDEGCSGAECLSEFLLDVASCQGVALQDKRCAPGAPDQGVAPSVTHALNMSLWCKRTLGLLWRGVLIKYRHPATYVTFTVLLAQAVLLGCFYLQLPKRSSTTIDWFAVLYLIIHCFNQQSLGFSFQGVSLRLQHCNELTNSMYSPGQHVLAEVASEAVRTLVASVLYATVSACLIGFGSGSSGAQYVLVLWLGSLLHGLLLHCTACALSEELAHAAVPAFIFLTASVSGFERNIESSTFVRVLSRISPTFYALEALLDLQMADEVYPCESLVEVATQVCPTLGIDFLQERGYSLGKAAQNIALLAGVVVGMALLWWVLLTLKYSKLHAAGAPAIKQENELGCELDCKFEFDCDEHIVDPCPDSKQQWFDTHSARMGVYFARYDSAEKDRITHHEDLQRLTVNVITAIGFRISLSTVDKALLEAKHSFGEGQIWSEDYYLEWFYATFVYVDNLLVTPPS
eukprot:TRINITY_DN16939_c0_g1_i1.p1 TRINITY_DN16939_c0_g1~~TRINITY_DN16939_c0_g1_i1.p1  ORF type:complete len:1206 (+),score=179.82 TRINITY_DN16939_c0_g1_i1:155-3772(+)